MNSIAGNQATAQTSGWIFYQLAKKRISKKGSNEAVNFFAERLSVFMAELINMNE